METHEFVEPGRSWALDLKNLVDHVTKGTPLLGDLESARFAMQMVAEAYRASGFPSGG